jgi:hypothetical protein
MSRARKSINAVVTLIMLFCCGFVGLASLTPDDATETETKLIDESVEEETEPTKPPTNRRSTNTATHTFTPFPIIIVSVNAANTRNGPGTNYEKITLVPNGEELQVLGTDNSGTWYNVILPDGDHAWIAASVVDDSNLDISIEIAETIPAPATTSSTETLEQAPQLPAAPVTPLPPPPTAEPPPPPSAPPEAPQAAVCECGYDAYNCSSFGTHNTAQACFNYCRSLGVGDIHRLDRDNDGSACESLP